MRTKFYLDKRTEAKALSEIDESGREYPIKIAINHGGSSAYLPTGVSVQISQWQSKPVGQVVNTPKAARLNIVLSEKKLAVDKIIEDLRTSGELHGATASEIREKVQRKLELDSYGTDNGETPVLVCFDKYIKSKKLKAKTIEGYNATRAKLENYGDFNERATFTLITTEWLMSFENYLSRTMQSANARSVHLRNLRSVFNFAITSNYTKAYYPFKRFKIASDPTADRSLTAEELRQLHDAPCNQEAEKYRDLFFLSFFLCGMNLEDILEVKKQRGDRIEKRRIKTGQPLTIKIEPEAKAIIDKYPSQDWLISLGHGVNYSNFLHRLNDSLKNIGKVYNPHAREWEGTALFPDLSIYWARYSFATIAAELDIPERTVGMAMGHSTSKSVTSIYMRVDMRKKIDAANRKVIDYVFPKNLESKK